jgi:hypothetical protein
MTEDEKEKVVYCEKCQTGWILNFKYPFTAKLAECPFCQD